MPRQLAVPVSAGVLFENYSTRVQSPAHANTHVKVIIVVPFLKWYRSMTVRHDLALAHIGWGWDRYVRMSETIIIVNPDSLALPNFMHTG